MMYVDNAVIFVIEHFPYDQITVSGGRIVMRGLYRTWVKIDLI